MQDDPSFVAAWKGCSAATAVRHLDVEAPQLFRTLYQMELRGAWQGGQVLAYCPFHTAHAFNLPAKQPLCPLSCCTTGTMWSCSLSAV